jgi:hypothetical protein
MKPHQTPAARLPDFPPLEPFRRDPLIRFLLRQRTWFGIAFFVVIYLLGAAASLADGSFFTVPRPELYGAGVRTVPFIGEPFTFVFVIIFYSLLLVYTRYFARQIERTIRMLYEREILDTQGFPPGDLVAVIQKRFDSNWAWAASAFLAIWFVVLWILSHSGVFDQNLHVVPYMSLRSSRWAFAWILAFSIIGPHLFMSVVWRIIVCSYSLHHLFGRTEQIQLQPLHPDRCCGLRFVGDFTLVMSGFVAFYPAFLTLLSALYPEFVETPALQVGLVYSGAFFYVAIASFVFLYPTYSAHALMAVEREEALYRLNKRFFKLYEDIFTENDVARAELTTIQEQTSLLNSIREYYREVEQRAVWPFDLRVVSQFLGVVGIPLLLMFLERLIG